MDRGGTADKTATPCSRKTWTDELTDAAVELLESEKNNREQRRKRREEREKAKETDV